MEAAGDRRVCIRRGRGSGRGRRAEQGGTGTQLGVVPGLAAHAEVHAGAAAVAAGEGWRSQPAARGAALLGVPRPQTPEFLGGCQGPLVPADAASRTPAPRAHGASGEVGVCRIVSVVRAVGSGGRRQVTTAAAEGALRARRLEPLHGQRPWLAVRPPDSPRRVRSEEPGPRLRERRGHGGRPPVTSN